MGSNQQWTTFGQVDPYFGVLADPKFSRDRIDPEARREFFVSGKRHVDRVLGIVREQLQPDFQPRRSLDFGCGVGRILVPLAGESREVVGLDVSAAMCEEARRNCEQRGLTNVRIVQSDDDLGGLEGKFDFIHSYIVLQHIPPARGMRLLSKLLDRLAENGVAVIHVTVEWRAGRLHRELHRLQGRSALVRRLVNVAKKRPLDYPFMQMFQYRPKAIIDLFESKGLPPSWSATEVHGQHHGLLFCAQRRAALDRRAT